MAGTTPPSRRPWRTTLPPGIQSWLKETGYLFDQIDDPLVMVRLISGWRDRQAELLALAVRDARREGRSWVEIGEALGMSRQQAHRTYARLVDDERSGD